MPGVGDTGEPVETSNTSNRNIVFLICAMAILMGSIDSTIVMTALPRIGRQFHARLNWTGWIVTIYSLGLILALPIAGRISDQFGRKRVFLTCVVLFGASSLACGLAPSIYFLIPLRFMAAHSCRRRQESLATTLATTATGESG